MNSLVLYADILGYRNLLRAVALKSLLDIQESLVGLVRAVANDQNATSHTRHSIREGQWGFYFAFDTLVFYFKDISDETFFARCVEFTKLCSWIYCYAFSRHSLKIRGVVSKSTNYLIQGSHLLIGEIGEIYDKERAIDFAGIRLDLPDFLSNAPRYGNWTLPPPDEPFVRYLPGIRYGYGLNNDFNVPFYITPLNRANLRRLRGMGTSYIEARKRLSAEAKDPGLDPRAEAKVRSTDAFLRHCEDHYNASGDLFYFFEGTEKIELS
jgi:hypothetical protein